MPEEVVIVEAVRTPVGRFLGKLSEFTAPELGAVVIRALLNRTKVKPERIDEVIMGNVVQAGVGQAPARQASINGCVPPTVPALTVNKVCGSGLKAVILAAQAIKCGDAQTVIAGGMESMSHAPYMIQGARTGLKMGNQQLVDLMIHDGLWCAFEQKHMGMAAEYTAKKSGITRAQQDKLAYESHRKAIAAMDQGKFAKELVSVQGKAGVIAEDETPRRDTSLEKLATLKPAFQEGGTVTAGNAPGLNDGASALLLMSKAEAERQGHKALATIVDYAIAGTEPRDLFYAPVHSTRKLMERMRVAIHHFDLIEVNEAFAAQALADGQELEWDWARVNVHGGAIALGHPIGASGARILTTLIWAMHDRGAQTGLATICMGAGNGISLAVRRG